MKKLGFVDYYISEWHADNYPEWIKKAAEGLGEEFKVSYVWAEQDISPVSGVSTDEWCKKYGTEKCASIKELCEKSDYVFVLAPSNPEKHFAYAEEVAKYGKTTYIDKTFAPDEATAKKIYECFDKAGLKFFTASAMRFADELKDNGNVMELTTTGGGSTPEEYIIHQVEIHETIISERPTEIKTERFGRELISTAKYGSGKLSTIIYCPDIEFNLIAKDDKGEVKIKRLESDMFVNLMGAILKFFLTNELPFSRNETIDGMKLREVILDKKNLGKWVKI